MEGYMYFGNRDRQIMSLLKLFCASSVIIMLSCGSNSEYKESDSNHEKIELVASVNDTSHIEYRTFNDTSFILKREGKDVSIHLKKNSDPSGLKIGNIVLLPGWNYSSLDWCNKTSICDKAKSLGYDLILVDMQKSVYSSRVYSETRSDVKPYPTRTWFVDTLIPHLQEEFGLLIEGQNNYVLGLSTGARGAALLSLDKPKIFKKGAALSGDYNQMAIPNDNLMNMFYGPSSSFKDRWVGEDNVVYQISRFKVPFYLGHGVLDKVCPSDQTIEFYDSLIKNHPDLEVTLHVDSLAGHNYKYWDSEVDNVLKFFLE
jgi:pimeloyl-ACP methyl ester carboxylesterase